MRLGRIAAVAAVALAVFVAVIAVTFPTDAILRALIARVTPSGSLSVSFAHAHVRPWGLRVDGVQPNEGPEFTIADPKGEVVERGTFKFG